MLSYGDSDDLSTLNTCNSTSLSGYYDCVGTGTRFAIWETTAPFVLKEVMLFS
jgi:hypothetical protein